MPQAEVRHWRGRPSANCRDGLPPNNSGQPIFRSAQRSTAERWSRVSSRERGSERKGRHPSYSSACGVRQFSDSSLRRLRKAKPQSPFKADSTTFGLRKANRNSPRTTFGCSLALFASSSIEAYFPLSSAVAQLRARAIACTAFRSGWSERSAICDSDEEDQEFTVQGNLICEATDLSASSLS